jgi:hypothetical protein
MGNELLKNTMDELKLLFVIIVLGLPYLLLLYKRVGVRVRLLFISIIEIFILCILSIAIDFGAEKLIGIAYSYEFFVALAILLNFIWIFLSWLFEKIKLTINRPKF